MNEMLRSAYLKVQQKDIESVAEVVNMLKALPRCEKGVFVLKELGEDVYEVASYAYPVYCAYETVCNKKEGYLDLMDQMRVWRSAIDAKNDLAASASFLQILIATIEQMSPEIYEYYRELVDMFREDVKKVLSLYYKDGGFADQAAAAKISDAIKRACAQQVLLAEKYEQYV